MFLSDDSILSEVEQGRLVIEPFEAELLKPASYALRLGNTFRVWSQVDDHILLWSPDAAGSHLGACFHADEITLVPNTPVLASTLEKIGVPYDRVGVISALSHIARFGVSVHLGAFWISPGFGLAKLTPLTLELISFNPSPIVIKAGTPICHLALAEVSTRTGARRFLQRSAYEGLEAPSAPLLFEEFDPVLLMGQ